MSDMIEEYLKNVIREQGRIEIKRHELAELFDCVPSQINYVINTRFTEQHGYLVESKRGGGGYIRIMKVKFLEEVDLLNEMIRIVGNSISERDAYAVVQNLYNQKIISKREGNLILAVMDKAFLQALQENEDAVRAGLLKKLLTSLRYEA